MARRPIAFLVAVLLGAGVLVGLGAGAEMVSKSHHSGQHRAKPLQVLSDAAWIHQGMEHYSPVKRM